MLVFPLKFGSEEHSSTKQFVGENSPAPAFPRWSSERQSCDWVVTAVVEDVLQLCRLVPFQRSYLCALSECLKAHPGQGSAL